MDKEPVKGPEKLNITFSGCGFLGIYHVGVASALKDRAPKLLERIENFGGASAGALAAGSLLCGISLSQSLDFTLRLAERASKLSIGPFHPRFSLTKTIYKVFKRMIPDDAYKLCSGKLHISLTRCNDWKNVVVSEFNSNEDLIDALVASAHVPFYSGFMPPKFRGVYHVDGGITNNLPQHFDGETITVAPWSGESDICPQDNSNSINHIMFTNTSIRFSSENLYRICRAFFPPDANVLSKMCKQGYKDTIRYLKTHYPEYLTECVGKERKLSCCRSISLEPASDPDPVDTCATDIEENFRESRVEVKNSEEQCGECRLHSMLEITKVDVMIGEKEYWSCYFLRMLYRFLVKPCVITVSKITLMAESVILKLPKVYTGVDFLDLLLHTINEAIVHYKIYQNIHSCDDSCSHESQIYRGRTYQLESTNAVIGVDVEITQKDDLSADYETACSESSYTTCQSSVTDYEENLETCSSSSNDTIVDDLFLSATEEFRSCIGQLPEEIRPYPLGDKMRWDDDVGTVIQSYS